MDRWLTSSIVILLSACLAPGIGGEGSERVHDPSRLFERDGTRMLLSSGSEGVALRSWRVDLETGRIMRDADLDADALAGDWWRQLQEWNPTGEFDAPAVSEDGTRVYFTVFDEDEEIQDAIGLAEWTGAAWEARGIVVRSEGEGPDTPRAMDASVARGPDGSWLLFGSHAGGLYVTELDPETGLLVDDPGTPETDTAPERFIRVAADTQDEDAQDAGIEAGYLHRRGDRWTLFFNVGRCCNGLDSTYEVRVGQADEPTGPFLDRDGVPLLDGGGTPFLMSEGRFHGPGHVGISGDLLTVHFYDGAAEGRSDLLLRELEWAADGWPVAGGVVWAPAEEPDDD